MDWAHSLFPDNHEEVVINYRLLILITVKTKTKVWKKKTLLKDPCMGF
jgi:hypothetical protein